METFVKNCLVEMTFKQFKPLPVVMNMASDAVQKIATDQKEYRKCSSCVIIC